jgi:hypothetical protein
VGHQVPHQKTKAPNKYITFKFDAKMATAAVTRFPIEQPTRKCLPQSNISVKVLALQMGILEFHL